MYGYCQFCEGPLKDEHNFAILHVGAEELCFCNKKERRDWIVDNPECAADIIEGDPELVESVGE